MATELIEEYKNPEYPVSIKCVKLERSTEEEAEPVYRSKEPEMLKVYEGELFVEAEGRTECVRPGEGAFIKKTQVHRIWSETGARYYSIVLDPEFVIRKHARSPMTKKYYDDLTETGRISVVYLNPERLRDEQSLNRIEAIICANCRQEPGFELITLGHLALLWVALLQRFLSNEEKYTARNAPSRDEKRVKEAREFIDRSFAEDLALSDIAAKIHVSPNECCREFKRIIGVSPVDYLVRRRVYEAARIMYKDPTSADSISEVAFNVGFNTISYFNRMFKRFMFSTPSEFVRMLKENDNTAVERFKALENMFR
ncbi:MAG: AraC family transcriptional regulator [Lachnospiraceae bacterium]|nr:AraC family transcriptional regulator [Lachnospiraceae bacterium]